MFDQNQSNQNLGQPGVAPIQPQPSTTPSPEGSVNNPEASNPWLKQASSPAQPPYGNTSQPEDMFATTRDIPAPSNFNNQYGQTNQAYSQMPPAMNYGAIYGGRGIDFGKIIIILLGLILFTVAVVVVYFTYNYFSSRDLIEEIVSQETTNQTTTNNFQHNTQENNTQNQIVTSTIFETSTSTPNHSVVNSEKDSDGDGLTDAEELELKTNPNNADTDSDGLTDWAEIKLYNTDPLNPDTDSDGYKDGEEVVKGYDPNRGGNARLFEVPR